jgi:serine/threonine-protein kinase
VQKSAVLLGEGAFSEVYLVRHDFLGRQAMKVFKLLALDKEETRELLLEPKLLSSFEHPNVIRIYEANVVQTTQGRRTFFTMDYVAGGTLDRRWRSYGDRFVPVETTVDIVRQICRGLEVAHSATPPIIHRDIKPQNILAGIDGTGLRVRISDFGLAKRVNPLTLAATAAGTTAFKPPEVFTREKADSAAADTWAVGTILYLLLTDRLPFPAAEGAWGEPARFAKQAPPPSRFNCLAGATLDAVCAQALAPEPRERFQNATEFLAALRDWSPAAVPAATPAATGHFDGESSKTILGPAAVSQNEAEARRLAESALRLARQSAQLAAAADAMEEAFNKWPGLREKHAAKVKLWRCGIATPTALHG